MDPCEIAVEEPPASRGVRELVRADLPTPARRHHTARLAARFDDPRLDRTGVFDSDHGRAVQHRPVYDEVHGRYELRTRALEVSGDALRGTGLFRLRSRIRGGDLMWAPSGPADHGCFPNDSPAVPG